MAMKKIKVLLVALTLSASSLAHAAYTADTPRILVTAVKTFNDNRVQFWVNTLPTGCTGTSFSISTSVTDAVRNRYLSLLTTALSTGKKVRIGYDTATCNVTPIVFEAVDIAN